jgi:hypothetical protein
MISQFQLIQRIYQIIAGGNIQDLPLLNAFFDEYFSLASARINLSSFSFPSSASSSLEELNYFYSLYPKLLDRLYGGNCTGYQDDGSGANYFQVDVKWQSSSSSDLLHGWLKTMIAYTVQQNQRNINPQVIKQNFVNIFRPFQKLFNLLEKTKYEIDLSLFPEKIQMILASHPLMPLLLNEQNASLLSLCFRLPPSLSIPFNDFRKVSSFV